VGGSNTRTGPSAGAVSSATSDVSAAQQRVSTATSGYDAINTSYTSLKTDLTDAQSDVTKARAASTAADAAYTKANGGLSDLRSSVTTAETALKTNKTEITSLTTELSDLKSQKSAADALVTTTKSAYETAQGKTKTATANLKTANDSYDTAHGKVGPAEAAAATAKGKIAPAQSAVDSASAKVGPARDRIAAAEGKVSSAQQRVSSAQQKVTAAQAYLNAHPNDAAAKTALANAKSALSTAKTALANAKSELSTAKTALATAIEAERRAKEALAAAKLAAAEAERKAGEARTAAAAALKVKEAALKALELAKTAEAEAKTVAEKAVTAAAKAATTVTDAEKALKTAKDKTTTLTSDVTKAKDALKTAETALKDLKKDQEDAKADLDKATKLVTDLKPQVDAKKIQLDDAREARDRAKKELDTAKTHLKTLQGQAQVAIDQARATEKHRPTTPTATSTGSTIKHGATAPSAVAGANGPAAAPDPASDPASSVNLDQVSPEERQRLLQEQAELEAREQKIRDDQAAAAATAAIKKERTDYVADNPVWVDQDGTTYSASVSSVGELVLTRNDAIIEPTEPSQPRVKPSRQIKIQVDKSREDKVVLASIPTGTPNEVVQTRTDIVHTDPTGMPTGGQVINDQEQTTEDGTYKRASATEIYDADAQGAFTLTEQQFVNDTVAPNGDGQRTDRVVSIGEDGATPTHESSTTVTKQGADTATENIESSFQADGYTLAQQQITNSGTGQVTVASDTAYTTAGVPTATQISRDASATESGELPDGVEGNEFFAWGTNGKATQHLIGQDDQTFADYQTYNTDRADAGAVEQVGNFLSDTFNPVKDIREGSIDPLDGHDVAVAYTRGSNNKFTGVEQDSMLAEPLQPTSATPNVFEIPATLRARGAAASIDATAPAVGSPEYEALVNEQDSYEADLAAAKSDSERTRLQREYYADHDIYVDRGPDGTQDPVFLASAYSYGLPANSMFGGDRVSEPHAILARTGIEGQDKYENPATIDLLRHDYSDGTSDDITRITTDPAALAGGTRVEITGEHFEANGVRSASDTNVQATVSRATDGLPPLAVTEVSRLRFDAVTGEADGEQYYATATSDESMTTLTERTDTFAAGEITDTIIDKTEQSRDWQGATTEDFLKANDEAMYLGRTDKIDVNNDSTSITTPPIGSYATSSHTDIDYTAGVPTHSETHEVSTSVAAMVDTDEKDGVTTSSTDSNGVKVSTVTTDKVMDGNGSAIYDENDKPLVDQSIVTNMRSSSFDPDRGSAGGDHRDGHQFREVTDVTIGSNRAPNGDLTTSWVTPYTAQMLLEGQDDDRTYTQKQILTKATEGVLGPDDQPFEIVFEGEGDDQKPVLVGDNDTYTGKDGKPTTQSENSQDGNYHTSDTDFADDYEKWMEDHSTLVTIVTIAAGVAMAAFSGGTSLAAAIAFTAAAGVGLATSTAQFLKTRLDYSQDEASLGALILDGVGVVGFAAGALKGVTMINAARGANAAAAAIRGGTALATVASSSDDLVNATATGFKALSTVGRVEKSLNWVGNAGDIYDGANAVKAGVIDGNWGQAAMFAGMILLNHGAAFGANQIRASRIDVPTIGGSSSSATGIGNGIPEGINPIEGPGNSHGIIESTGIEVDGPGVSTTNAPPLDIDADAGTWTHADTSSGTSTATGGANGAPSVALPAVAGGSIQAFEGTSTLNDGGTTPTPRPAIIDTTSTDVTPSAVGGAHGGPEAVDSHTLGDHGLPADGTVNFISRRTDSRVREPGESPADHIIDAHGDTPDLNDPKLVEKIEGFDTHPVNLNQLPDGWRVQPSGKIRTTKSQWSPEFRNPEALDAVINRAIINPDLVVTGKASVKLYVDLPEVAGIGQGFGATSTHRVEVVLIPDPSTGMWRADTAYPVAPSATNTRTGASVADLAAWGANGPVAPYAATPTPVRATVHLTMDQRYNPPAAALATLTQAGFPDAGAAIANATAPNVAARLEDAGYNSQQRVAVADADGVRAEGLIYDISEDGASALVRVDVNNPDGSTTYRFATQPLDAIRAGNDVTLTRSGNSGVVALSDPSGIGAIENHMANGTIVDGSRRVLRRGMSSASGENVTIETLRLPDGSTMDVVRKTANMGAAQEVTAWETAKLLGVESYLPAVVRAPNGDALIQYVHGADAQNHLFRTRTTVQEAAEATVRRRFPEMEDADVRATAATDLELLDQLDFLVGNHDHSAGRSDRFQRNALIEPDGSLRVIDFGAADLVPGSALNGPIPHLSDAARARVAITASVDRVDLAFDHLSAPLVGNGVLDATRIVSSRLEDGSFGKSVSARLASEGAYGAPAVTHGGAAAAPDAAPSILGLGTRNTATPSDFAPLEGPVPAQSVVNGGLQVDSTTAVANPELLVGAKVQLADPRSADRIVWTVDQALANGDVIISRELTRTSSVDAIAASNPQLIEHLGGIDAVRATPSALLGWKLDVVRSDGSTQRGWSVQHAGGNGGRLILGIDETLRIPAATAHAGLTSPIDFGATVVKRQRADASFDGRAAISDYITANPTVLENRPLRLLRSESSIAEGRAAQNISDGWKVISSMPDGNGSLTLTLARDVPFSELGAKAQANARIQGYHEGSVIPYVRRNIPLSDVVDYNKARLEGNHGQLPQLNVFDGELGQTNRLGTNRDLVAGPSNAVADQAVVHTQAALDYLYSRYGYVPSGGDINLIVNSPSNHRNASMQSDGNVLRIGTHETAGGAFDPGVIMHELGHKFVSDHTIDHYGNNQAGAIHEGVADVLSIAWTHDPVIGRVFNGATAEGFRNVATGANLITTRQQWSATAARQAQTGVSAHAGGGVVSQPAAVMARTIGWAETGDLYAQALRTGGLATQMDFTSFSDSIRIAAAQKYGVGTPNYLAVTNALYSSGLISQPSVGQLVGRISSRNTVETNVRIDQIEDGGTVIVIDSQGRRYRQTNDTLLTGFNTAYPRDASGNLIQYRRRSATAS